MCPRVSKIWYPVYYGLKIACWEDRDIDYSFLSKLIIGRFAMTLCPNHSETKLTFLAAM